MQLYSPVDLTGNVNMIEKLVLGGTGTGDLPILARRADLCAIKLHISMISLLCSGSLVVTAYDFESGHPDSNPEWGLICYKASITAQGLPEPSSLRGSTLGTRSAEHKGCNWGMQID